MAPYAKGKGKSAWGVLNPATNKAERAVLEAYRAGVAVNRNTKGSKGREPQNAWQQPKGNGKSAGKSERWSCTFCFSTNPAQHVWCNTSWCKMHYLDAAHLAEEAMTGSMQASKGKGKDTAGQKDAGVDTVSPKVVPPAAEEPRHAKSLLTMGLYPAPELDMLKPYPKPSLKADDTEVADLSGAKVQHLEASLEDALAKGFSPCLVNLLKKEITTAKAEQTKASKGNATKGIVWEALVKRIANADTAAAAALERHKEHVLAVDEQILQLQKIREHRIADFTASQKAFAARRVEDLKLQAEMIAKTTVQGTTEAMEEDCTKTRGSAQEDLARTHRVAVEDFPPLLDNPHEALVKQHAALYWFYSRVGFDSCPHSTFKDVGCNTATVHGLVGDTIWNGFWQDKSTCVQQTDYIPSAMHNAMKHQVMRCSEKLSAVSGAEEDSKASYDALLTRMGSTVKGFSPYPV